jgi:hypothetical protein
MSHSRSPSFEPQPYAGCPNASFPRKSPTWVSTSECVTIVLSPPLHILNTCPSIRTTDILESQKGKGEDIPLTSRKQIGAWRHISTHSSRRQQIYMSDKLQASVALPHKNPPRYPLNKDWVGCTAGLIVLEEKFFPLTVFEPRTAQAVAHSLYGLSYRGSFS